VPGPKIIKLVLKLPLTVAGLAGQQHPNKLVRVYLNQGAPPGPALRAGRHATQCALKEPLATVTKYCSRRTLMSVTSPGYGGAGT
jgi:hypothetical protein